VTQKRYKLASKFNYKPIGRDAQLYSGFAFKSSDYCDAGIPIIKIGNLQNKKVDFTAVSYFSCDKITPKHYSYFLNDKDVLVAMTGQGSVGRVSCIRKNRLLA
jgi:type I restriction enzyme S subunit